MTDKEFKEKVEKMRTVIVEMKDSIPWRNTDYDDGWIEALEWILDDVIKYLD